MALIRTCVDQSIMTIELNRPEKLNALNLELKADLADAIEAATEDVLVKAVILTGAGRAFCAGSDVADFKEEPGLEYRERLRALHSSLVQGIARCPKPFIAAVNGPAVGAGFGLALACDLVVATEKAYFEAPVARTLGIVPDFGLAYTLQTSVGLNRARSILLFGRRLAASDALDWGLVDQTTIEDDLLNISMEIARETAEAPLDAIAGIKRLLAYGAYSNLDQLLDTEADEQSLLRTSATHLKKVQAHKEKRSDKHL